MIISSIYAMLPDAENLLSLEPEELAGYILSMWNSNPNFVKENKHNFGLYDSVREYPDKYHREILQALMEAWAWLEGEGLIAEEPGELGWYFITRRGRKMRSSEDFKAYQKANLLQKQLLHPRIAQEVWSNFLRGKYDTTVFQAFKEVEVAVRKAGGYSETDLGTALMRKAFNVDNGPLTNKSGVAAENQALSDLFAGAIGAYKNPHSHRNVVINAEEAVELLIFASHLLKIVDSIKEKLNSGNVVQP